MTRLRLLFFLLLCTWGAWSCSGGPSAPAPDPSERLTEPFVFAQLYLAGNVPDIPVRLEDLSGAPLAEAVTNRDGLVVFRDLTVPDDFRAVAWLGSVELVGEVRGFHTHPTVARITLLTTLASLSLRAHPEETLEQAEARVKSAVGMPQGVHLGHLFTEPNPFYSDLALARAVARRGGWEAFARGLPETGDYRLTLGDLSSPVEGPDPVLTAALEASRLKLLRYLGYRPRPGSTRPLIAAIPGPSSLFGQFVLGVGTGIVGNVATGFVFGGAKLLFGWAATELGLNFGTSGQLHEISETLDEVLTLVEGIATQGSSDALQQQLDELQRQVVPVQNATATLRDDTASADITDQPFSPPPSVADLVRAIDAPDYPDILTNVQDGMVGAGNVQARALQDQLQTQLGIDQPPQMYSCPWRSNHLLDVVLQIYQKFGGAQVMALNLLAEQAHNPALNPDPVLGINAVLPTFRDAMASLKLQGQVLPLEASQWGPIIDFENGVMWFEYVYDPLDWETAGAYMQHTPTDMVFPDGSTVTYDDWRLPTVAECLSLQRRGTYNPTKDPTVAVNSHDAYPDTGQATAGLPSLGFQQADLLDSDGTLWTLAIDSPGQSPRPNEAYKLNHASGLDQKSSSDSFPFVMCRTFGPNFTTPPYLSGDVTPVPPGIKASEFTSGEFVNFGVPVSIDQVTATQTGVNLQLSARVNYQIVTGGAFTMGRGTVLPVSFSEHIYTGGVVTTDQLQSLVAWGSSDSAVAEVFNLPGLDGLVIPHQLARVTFSASLLGADGKVVTGTLDYTPTAVAPHTLTSLQISPRNQIYGASAAQPATGSYPLYCTGFYSDQVPESLAQAVTWTLTPTPNPANLTITKTASGVILQMNQPGQTVPTPYEVTLTATLGDVTDTAKLQIVPPLPLDPATAPVLNALEPTTGPAAGGYAVVLKGLRLGQTALVRVESQSVDFTVNTNNEVTLTMPSGAAGSTVAIRLSTPAGDAVANFKYGN